MSSKNGFKRSRHYSVRISPADTEATIDKKLAKLKQKIVLEQAQQILVEYVNYQFDEIILAKGSNSVRYLSIPAQLYGCKIGELISLDITQGNNKDILNALTAVDIES